MKFKKIELFTAMVCSFFLLSACTSTKKRAHSDSSQTITSLAPTTPFDSNTIDGVLATITDQVLLLSDLQQAILVSTNGQTRLLPNGQLIGGSLTTTQADQILDTLINQKILQIKAIELGFDIQCLAYYDKEKNLKPIDTDYVSFRGLSEGLIPAPLWQQAFEWLRKKYRYMYMIDDIGVSASETYGYRFTYLIWKIVGTGDDDFSIVDKSFLGYLKYEEAQEACLVEIIKDLKSKI